jgi:hypothetical protein
MDKGTVDIVYRLCASLLNPVAHNDNHGLSKAIADLQSHPSSYTRVNFVHTWSGRRSEIVVQQKFCRRRWKVMDGRSCKVRYCMSKRYLIV